MPTIWIFILMKIMTCKLENKRLAKKSKIRVNKLYFHISALHYRFLCNPLNWARANRDREGKKSSNIKSGPIALYSLNMRIKGLILTVQTFSM